jgi:hypothetical protein
MKIVNSPLNNGKMDWIEIFKWRNTNGQKIHEKCLTSLAIRTCKLKLHRLPLTLVREATIKRT